MIKSSMSVSKRACCSGPSCTVIDGTRLTCFAKGTEEFSIVLRTFHKIELSEHSKSDPAILA